MSRYDITPPRIQPENSGLKNIFDNAQKIVENGPIGNKNLENTTILEPQVVHLDTSPSVEAPPSEKAVSYLESQIRIAKRGEDKNRSSNLTLLKFDIEDQTSVRAIADEILEFFEKGSITVNDKDTLLGLLGVDSVVPKEKTVVEIMDQNVPPMHLEKDSVIIPHNSEDGTLVPLKKEVAVRENLSMEELETELNSVFDAYVTERTAYQNDLHEKKNVFGKMMQNLGVTGRVMPETERPQAFVDAENALIAAKKNIRMALLGQGKTNFFEQTEKERLILDRKLVEAKPPLERGIAGKAFDRWQKAPMWVRTMASTGVIMAAGYSVDALFGTHFGKHFATTGTAAAAIGGRYVRSLVGGALAQPVGKFVDSITKKRAEKRTGEALDKYVKTFNTDEFEANERAWMQFLEKEADNKRKNTWIKVAAMMGTGAGVTIGLSPLNASIDHMHAAAIPTVEAAHISPTPTHMDVPPQEIPHAQVPDVETMQPVSVELSSKGFISTIADLKAHLKAQYPEPVTAPLEAREILTLSPEKLAEKFGLYHPGEMQSAYGLAGDHLTLDSHDNLVLEGIKGKQVLFDSDTGQAHQYHGAMFDAKSGKVMMSEPAPEPLPETPPHIAAETGPIDHIDHTPPHEVWASDTPDPVRDFSVPGGKVHIFDGHEHHWSGAYFDNKEMVKPGDGDFRSVTDIMDGKLALKPEFQFDPQFKSIRNAYNIVLQKAALNWHFDGIDTRAVKNYLGGQIFVLRKGDNLVALLNGQKLATGKVIAGGVGWQYDQSLGKGMFGKNDFEKAFEAVKEIKLSMPEKLITDTSLTPIMVQ